MTINNVASNQLNTSMIRIATGQRINSARDDAAGLAISERMTGQITGFERGTQNVMDMQNLVNTAEGGLSTISNSLQRIRELTIQAGSGIMTQDDRGRIQDEINQLMQEIDGVTERTEFNTMRLLDGSFNAEDRRGLHTAADPSGRGPTISIGNMSSSMLLGPEPLNVDGAQFGSAEIQTILGRVDNALNQVSGQRSYLGAMSNRFDTTIASNQIANLNLTSARSGIRDADIALEVMRMNQAQVLEQMQLFTQQRNMQQQGVQILSTFA